MNPILGPKWDRACLLYQPSRADRVKFLFTHERKRKIFQKLAI